MRTEERWTIESIRKLVIEIVSEVSDASETAIDLILPNMAPLEDIEHFDSLESLEAVVLIQEQIQVELPDDLFIHKSGKKVRARTIDEVATIILAYISGKGTLHA